MKEQIVNFPVNSSEKKLFLLLKADVQDKGKILYVGCLLQRAAVKYGEKVALISDGQSITFKELYGRAVKLSKKLIQLGIGSHDRVLIFFENSVAFYVVYFAVLQVGGVVAPLNTLLHDTELVHIIKDAQPRLLIVSDTCAQRLAACKDLDLPPLLTESDCALREAVPESILSDFEIVERGPDDLTVLLYTSGTTGLPKGVMLSSKNIITNVIQSVSRMSFYLKADDRLFGVLPLFHSFSQFACVWAALYFGTTVIVVSKIDRRHILEGLKQKPTIFLGVPALYGLLCLMKTAPLGSVRYFVSGGDALSDRIRSAFALLYRRKICSGYGLTETSPVVAAFIDDELVPAGHVGYLLYGIDAQVRGEDGNSVEHGQVGELWLRGDNVMLGYYNEAKMTQAVLQAGWFRTGDLVYFDKQGRLVIAGRLKDLIIHKGLNIYPAEIENIISSHPSVFRVGVIGEQFNEEEVPVAYVQVRKFDAQIEGQLKKMCLQSLAKYKIPKRIVITTKDLPTTATGKIHKNRLKQMVKDSKL